MILVRAACKRLVRTSAGLGRMSCNNSKGKMMPHALLIPLPAQGHINPMMHLASKLISHGFLVTFLNTEQTHQRIIQANKDQGIQQSIRMISAPQPQPQPAHQVLPAESKKTVTEKFFGDVEIALAPSVVDKVIREINERDDEEHKISCIIADVWTCFGLHTVAQLHHISLAALHTSLVSTFAIRYFSPKLVSLGLLPPDGIPKEDTTQQYLPSMPPLKPSHLPWLYGGEFMFRHGIRMGEETAKIEWILFNSFYELEPGVADDMSKEVGVYPIGPLISPELLDNDQRNTSTVVATPSFWKDDMECLEWLEKQEKQSVIYVAFGSLAVWTKRQVEELALGLEATQRPFLWVVRSDGMDGSSAILPEGFVDRVKERGFIVCWAPQVRVLSHPSIACFVTHCGWNSVQESIAMGVPMLCCPYFADQFLNSTYVAHVWKVGLRLEGNDDGLRKKEEIRNVIQRLVATEEGEAIREEIKRWSSVAKNAVKEGGSSSTNFKRFVDAMKR